MGYRYPRLQLAFGAPPTPAVRALLIACGLAYFLQWVLPEATLHFLALRPRWVWSRLYLWQPATYLFLHAGLLHLLLNLFALWMFGGQVERLLGRRKFIFYWFLTGIGAGLFQMAFSWNSEIPTVGSSGAIYGILLAFALFFPEQQVYIFPFLFFPIRAKYWALIMGAMAFLGSLDTPGGGVAHLAHLGGMLVGLLYLRGSRWTAALRGAWRRRRLRRLQRRFTLYRRDGPGGPWPPGDGGSRMVH